jgi:hypothetical protein
VSRAALEASGIADDFAEGEPPTIALSKPILRLLASESAAAETDEPPAAIPEPTLSAEPTRSDSSSSVVGVELDTGVKPAELSAPAMLSERASSGKKQAALLIAACLLAGAVFGSRAWILSHARAGFGRHAPTLAAASLPRPMDTKAPAPPSEKPEPSQTNAPTSAASSVTEITAGESSVVLSAPLLAVDGSERKAPSCDDLLANVPSEGEKALDHVRAARQALIRGDAVAAVPWAQETVRLDPRSPRALTLLGDAQVRAGNLKEARRAWLAASNLAEGDRAGIDRMAQAALAAADSALKERDQRLLRKVIAFQSENAAAHRKLASALTRLGFAQSAEAWTKRGAELITPK